MIIHWIAIGILVIIGFFFIKIDSHLSKIKIIVLIGLGFIMYFSIVSMLSSGRIDTDSPTSIVSSVYSYFGWLGDTALNLFDIGKDTVVLVGNAVKYNTTEINR